MELFVKSVVQDTKFLTGFALQTPAIIITVLFAKAMAFALTVILIIVSIVAIIAKKLIVETVAESTMMIQRHLFNAHLNFSQATDLVSD